MKSPGIGHLSLCAFLSQVRPHVKFRKIVTLLLLMLCLPCLASVSWLSESKNQRTTIQEVDRFLKPTHGKMRLIQCDYELASVSKLQVFDEEILSTETGMWSYTVDVKKVRNVKDALDLTVTFKLTEGCAASAGIAVAFDFAEWSDQNYVMIPASVYNGNRNRVVDRPYAAGLDPSDYYRKDLPMTTVALPQLSPDKGTLSKLKINTSYAATPAMCFFDKNTSQGFILLTEQGMEYNEKIIDHALSIEESSDRKMISLVVSAPGVLEKKPEFIGFSNSSNRAIDWKQGDQVTLRFRLYSFKTDGIPGLLEKFIAVRKEVTGQNEPRNLMPSSRILELMTQDIDRRYLKNDNFEYYCPENATWISFGWIGGMMNTFPMLVLGDAEHRDRVFSTFDFAIPRGQGESGFFHSTLGDDGKVFARDGYKNTPEIVLTRQNADVLFWMLKQFMLIKAQGHDVKPTWENQIKKQADAFVSLWQKEKQWGNFVDVKRGEIAVYNTSSGVMAIGGLALSSVYYQNLEYLKIAEDAAQYYYDQYFVKWGMTTGGCGDILQNSDSETAVAFMTSLMALYEITGQRKWLEKSRQLANLCATWVASYDYQLPVETPLYKLGAKLTGAVWASTQNKHGAPGFCCSSGDPLFKIYRETGDTRYAELMYDIVHAHAEGIQPNGQITERLTYCDADCKGDRLDGGKTGWNELNGALMAIELPGIYLRTDIDRMFVFDHIKVLSSERTTNSVKLKIQNPTEFDASVSILSESAHDVKYPLGYTAFLSWPKILIKAGDTIEHEIKK